jgi:hypothetical protein
MASSQNVGTEVDASAEVVARAGVDAGAAIMESKEKARDSGNPAVAKRFAGCRPYLRQPFTGELASAYSPTEAAVVWLPRVPASTSIAPAADAHCNRSPTVAMPDQMLMR